MKNFTLAALILFILNSCGTSKYPAGNSYENFPAADTPLTQSLFNDRSSTISEDNIQKILAGSYKLPEKLRVAVVKLQADHQRSYYYWNDEEYLKTQQSYIDLFTQTFQQSARVSTISIIPDLLISKSPTFTSIREAAVRMQADVVVVYAINSDIYAKYKLFSRPDIKAFATSQVIVLDVRTGLIPFSATVTKDYLAQRKKEELNNDEARMQIQKQAVLLTINEIGQRITAFLNTR